MANAATPTSRKKDKVKTEQDLRVLLKQAEANEKRFRTIIENSTNATQLVSATGEMLYTTDSIKNVIGYTPEELTGKNVPDYIHPDDLAYFMKNFRELLKKPGGQVTIQYRVKHKDGSWAWLETTGVNHLKTPNINALVGNFRNITKQKEYEEELKQSRDESEQRQRLYEAVTGSTLDLIYVFDLNYRFTYANKALLQMWGKTWEESIGKSLVEIGYESWHAEMHEREIDQVVKTKKPIRGEVPFTHATLGRRVYDYLFAPVFDRKKNVVAVAGITRDITEIRELAKQKDEFLGIASHELKTPVTSIKAYGQVLQRMFQKEGNTKAVAQLAKMDSQINRLTVLISDLLDVTKIQSGRLVLHNETYDFNQLASEIIDELQLTTDRHTLLKQFDKTKKLYGDRERIGQVLTNLITNAIKYSPHSKKIVISTEVTAETVTLCVKDFGIGIPDEKKGLVFEQFYRVSGDKQHTFPGLGLGLYISSEIVKRQGGRIWVESREGKGSTFCFSLPIKAPTKKQKSTLDDEAVKHE